MRMWHAYHAPFRCCKWHGAGLDTSYTDGGCSPSLHPRTLLWCTVALAFARPSVLPVPCLIYCGMPYLGFLGLYGCAAQHSIHHVHNCPEYPQPHRLAFVPAEPALSLQLSGFP